MIACPAGIGDRPALYARTGRRGADTLIARADLVGVAVAIGCTLNTLAIAANLIGSTAAAVDDITADIGDIPTESFGCGADFNIGASLVADAYVIVTVLVFSTATARVGGSTGAFDGTTFDAGAGGGGADTFIAGADLISAAMVIGQAFDAFIIRAKLVTRALVVITAFDTSIRRANLVRGTVVPRRAFDALGADADALLAGAESAIIGAASIKAGLTSAAEGVVADAEATFGTTATAVTVVIRETLNANIRIGVAEQTFTIIARDASDT